MSASQSEASSRTASPRRNAARHAGAATAAAAIAPARVHQSTGGTSNCGKRLQADPPARNSGTRGLRHQAGEAFLAQDLRDLFLGELGVAPVLHVGEHVGANV